MHLSAELKANLDYQIVSYSTPNYEEFVNPPPTPLVVQVEAPGGMKVVGGGYHNPSNQYPIGSNRPIEDGAKWEVRFEGPTFGVTTVYAVCVSAC